MKLNQISPKTQLVIKRYFEVVLWYESIQDPFSCWYLARFVSISTLQYRRSLLLCSCDVVAVVLILPTHPYLWIQSMCLPCAQQAFSVLRKPKRKHSSEHRLHQTPTRALSHLWSLFGLNLHSQDCFHQRIATTTYHVDLNNECYGGCNTLWAGEVLSIHLTRHLMSLSLVLYSIRLVLSNKQFDAQITQKQQVSATAAMRGVPRFGHTNDFSAALSNDDSEVEDYVLGLVFVAGFIMAVFLTWSILLLVFKCMGKKVGFLSGRPFQNTTRAFRVRVVFVGSVILFIMFAVLLVVNGITNLQDTLQTVSDTNQVRDDWFDAWTCSLRLLLSPSLNLTVCPTGGWQPTSRCTNHYIVSAKSGAVYNWSSRRPCGQSR